MASFIFILYTTKTDIFPFYNFISIFIAEPLGVYALEIKLFLLYFISSKQATLDVRDILMKDWTYTIYLYIADYSPV